MSPIPAYFQAPTPPSVMHAPLLYAFSVFGLLTGTATAAAWAWRTGLSMIHRPFPFQHPTTAWRLVRVGAALGIILFIGPDMANIMLWPEVTPATRYWMADLNRFFDGLAPLPLVVAFGLCGLSGPLVEFQLSREPIDWNMWPKPRQYGRALGLTALLLVITLGVTVFRP
jgi:hypothetical protein